MTFSAIRHVVLVARGVVQGRKTVKKNNILNFFFWLSFPSRFLREILDWGHRQNSEYWPNNTTSLSSGRRASSSHGVDKTNVNGKLYLLPVLFFLSFWAPLRIRVLVGSIDPTIFRSPVRQPSKFIDFGAVRWRKGRKRRKHSGISYSLFFYSE
jgi:hypothetical protein